MEITKRLLVRRSEISQRVLRLFWQGPRTYRLQLLRQTLRDVPVHRVNNAVKSWCKSGVLFPAGWGGAYTLAHDVTLTRDAQRVLHDLGHRLSIAQLQRDAAAEPTP